MERTIPLEEYEKRLMTEEECASEDGDQIWEEVIDDDEVAPVDDFVNHLGNPVSVMKAINKHYGCEEGEDENAD